MFGEKIYPEYLSPEELDEYLNQGWYRQGQSIFTTHFLFFHGGLYSAIWIRQDLEGFKFRKSNRRVLRNCHHNFQVSYGPLKMTEEKEALYQVYRNSFPGILTPSLKESLFEEYNTNVYNSWEVCLRDGQKLIAYSIFDLGKSSLASIVGVYDPAYQKFSPGYSTMLLEVQYGLENGLKWFYPGYIVPGNTRFDYKIRIGATESYDLGTKTWIPTADFLSRELPVDLIHRKLAELADFLSQKGIPSFLFANLLLEANFYSLEDIEFLDAPHFLLLYPETEKREFAIVTYNLSTGHYELGIYFMLETLDKAYWTNLPEDEQPYSTAMFSLVRRIERTPDMPLISFLATLFE